MNPRGIEACAAGDSLRQSRRANAAPIPLGRDFARKVAKQFSEGRGQPRRTQPSAQIHSGDFRDARSSSSLVMRAGLMVNITPRDRRRFEAIVGDSNAAGVSLHSGQRILEAHQLAPYRIRTLKLSRPDVRPEPYGYRRALSRPAALRGRALGR